MGVKKSNMQSRGKLFWLKKKGKEKDLLVFWAGDPLGNVFIYEFKETKHAIEMESILQNHDRECQIYDLGNYTTVFSAGEWKLLNKSL
jgi:hypothetical protein